MASAQGAEEWRICGHIERFESGEPRVWAIWVNAEGKQIHSFDAGRQGDKRIEVVAESIYQGAVSGVARARGLAEALAKCPDDHTVEGVRAVGAEIAALLAAVGGQ